MTSRQARFTTACQQLLALAAVLAIVIPAANVVSLDVVGDTPAAQAPATPPPGGSGVAAAATQDSSRPQSPEADATEQRSEVAAAPVDAGVTEYDLTSATSTAPGTRGDEKAQRLGRAADSGEAPMPSDTASADPTPEASSSATIEPEGTQTENPATQESSPAVTTATPDGRTELLAAPQQVDTFGTVGVTWDADQEVGEAGIEIQIRTNTDGDWSGWSDLEYHDEHGPDPDTTEASRERPGTEPTVVGRVDQVQVRTITDGTPPRGLRMAVVEAEELGSTPETEIEAPAIDTATLPDPDSATDDGSEASSTTGEEGAGSDGLVLQAKKLSAPKPTIYSRAQWGANESIRDKSSLHYGSINGGFVHHTVNGNDYTKAEVPGIIRSIYSYHVRSRGWSDIGYNFLIDKFGRIWEGRYGGVNKAVVGAHTLNYNQYSFAASAIGNYDIAQPSQALLNAYASLFAWKLGANGVSASSTKQKIGAKNFQAISGHRDAGSTACPGRYLYAKIPQIRNKAAALQKGATPPVTPPPATNDGTNLGSTWTGAAIRSSLTSRTYPDLVVRRASDGRGLVLPTGGLTNFAAPRSVSTGWSKKRQVFLSPDLTGDGRADLVMVSKKGFLAVKPGQGGSRFGRAGRVFKAFRNYRQVTAVGDINGDGRADLIARHRKTKRTTLILQTRKHRFRAVRLGRGFKGYSSFVGVGDVTSDGRRDLVAKDASGRLVLRINKGGGKFRAARVIPGNWSGYRAFVGGADFTGDGRPDLLARTSSGAMMIFPSKGDGTFGTPFGPTRTSTAGMNQISTVGNLVDGAGADLVARRGNSLVVLPNAETYELGNPIDTGRSFAKTTLVLNAGDWDRDGKGDVIARMANGNLVLYRGKGGGRLAKRAKIGSGWQSYSNVQVIGDVTGDGFPDLAATDSAGTKWLYPGNGKAGFKPRIAAPSAAFLTLPVSTAGYDWVLGVSSLARTTQSADAVVRERSTGRLFVLDAASGYRIRRLLGEGMTAYDLAD